jgi:hypothetical protein
MTQLGEERPNSLMLAQLSTEKVPLGRIRFHYVLFLTVAPETESRQISHES